MNNKRKKKREDRLKYEDLPFNEKTRDFELAYGQAASDASFAMRMCVILKYDDPSKKKHNVATRPLTRLEMFEQAESLLKRAVAFWEKYKKAELPKLVEQEKAKLQEMKGDVLNALDEQPSQPEEPVQPAEGEEEEVPLVIPEVVEDEEEDEELDPSQVERDMTVDEATEELNRLRADYGI